MGVTNGVPIVFMWFQRNVANPVIGWILRSPFHGLMSRATVLIEYVGRSSGRRYRLVTQYAQRPGQLVVWPGGAERKTWWRNFRGGAPLRVWLRGEVIEGEGRVIDDPAGVAEALRLYFERWPRAAKGFAEPGGTDDLTQSVAGQVVVLIDLA